MFVAIPWFLGMVFGNVRKLGQIAPSMTRTVLAPFMVWMANQNIANIAREMIAIYEPQNPQLALASTGNDAWWITPVAPFRAMTMETMKKLMATMDMDSLQVRPMAIILLANSHVAALKASDIQYAMKLITLRLVSIISRYRWKTLPPFPSMSWNRIKILVRPSGVSFCECRFRAVDLEGRELPLHLE